MLESVFILSIILAYISLVLAIKEESTMYSILSIFFSILMMAGQVYIVTPGVADYETEPWALAMGIGLAIINGIWIVVMQTAFARNKSFESRTKFK